jgi:uncharacterized membrane protein YfhO
MKKLSRFFYKFSSGWVVLAALLVFILFAIFILPDFSEQSALYWNGMGSPDTTLFYSGADLYAMAEAYGEEGRQAFVDMRWTLDLAFPLIYTLFLVTSASWLLRRLILSKSNWRLVNLFPLAAFILDLLENSATSLVMLRFPERCLFGQVLAPIISPLKWLAVAGSFLLIICAGVIYLFRRLKKTGK